MLGLLIDSRLVNDTSARGISRGHPRRRGWHPGKHPNPSLATTPCRRLIRPLEDVNKASMIYDFVRLFSLETPSSGHHSQINLQAKYYVRLLSLKSLIINWRVINTYFSYPWGHSRLSTISPNHPSFQVPVKLRKFRRMTGRGWSHSTTEIAEYTKGRTLLPI
jgi:hypothetical protein